MKRGASRRGAGEEPAPEQSAPRIDLNLDTLERELGDLEWEIEHELAHEPDGPFALRWNLQVVRGGWLEQAERDYREGRMRAEQEERFRSIKRAFAAKVPLMESAGLATPRIPLDD